MKKPMRDVSFEEFDEWANRRACDGTWSMTDAILSAEAIRKVFAVKSLFGRKKKRELEWKRIREEYFDMDAEIDV